MKPLPEQLELFDYRKPAQVIFLPVSVWGRTKWQDLADACVDLIMTRPDEEYRWWRGIDHQIGQDMRALGLSAGEVVAEIHKARQYVAHRLVVMRRDRRIRSAP